MRSLHAFSTRRRHDRIVARALAASGIEERADLYVPAEWLTSAGHQDRHEPALAIPAPRSSDWTQNTEQCEDPEDLIHHGRGACVAITAVVALAWCMLSCFIEPHSPLARLVWLDVIVVGLIVVGAWRFWAGVEADRRADLILVRSMIHPARRVL